MIKRAIYPGSFDPVTKGHLDIIQRASKLTEELIVAVLQNSSKSNIWFSVEERINLLKHSISELDVENCKIKVIAFKGLLVDLIEREDVDVLIRGLRAVSDYEYEVQLDLTNKQLTKKEFETIFLNSSRKYLYLSSSIVRDVALHKGELKYFVTDYVKKELMKKVDEMNGKK
ncbi:pantetheine-phosphate adenylyltransferase [Sneathia sanguinegens]|uniref:pantetheine-phosphate adenylyltransferase n=1 Tax=Sneathia sanguinegens TaxID=40543 RepID=UPI000834092C|nr:pantetheine-phosphate adenylyltransferase [Sneathia sanguinegens]MDU4652284.1 pantetheine-phosphate adenylyltransferase [Sneathia sanguinegens]